MQTSYLILLLGWLLASRCDAQDVAPVPAPAARAPAPAVLAALQALSPGERRALLEPAPAPGPRRHHPGPAPAGARGSPFISALRGAWKKGIVEESFEGYSEVLIQCQKETSPALTMPFLRSDSQQAHCFRF
jgi:hypothetical protein